MNIILIGYRCTGKSTTGRLLARVMGFGFVDTDQMVEVEAGMSISEMVAEKGWAYFRQKEREALIKALGKDKRVIATGGGIVLDPDNLSLIRQRGFTVWLEADRETIIQRLAKDTGNIKSRPNLSQVPLALETKKLLKIRNPLYRSAADRVLNTAAISTEEAAFAIQHMISRGE